MINVISRGFASAIFIDVPFLGYFNKQVNVSNNASNVDFSPVQKQTFSGLYQNFRFEGPFFFFSGIEQTSSRIMVCEQNFEQNKRFL